jgi:hypothetical protein
MNLLVHKNRAIANKIRKELNLLLVGIFVSTFAAFLYFLSSSWVTGGDVILAGIPMVYYTGGLSALSFFSFRMINYRERYEKTSFVRRLSISIFDLVAYLCVVALVAWGFIFLLLRQIPQNFQLHLLNQNSLALNLYVGLIFCTGIIIFRVALQPLISKSKSVMIISPPQNTSPVISTPAADPRIMDNRMFEMLASINKEISKIHEQINLLSKNSEFVPRSGMTQARLESRSASTGVVRVAGIENRGRPIPSPIQSNVEPSTTNLEKVPPSGPAVVA